MDSQIEKSEAHLYATPRSKDDIQFDYDMNMSKGQSDMVALEAARIALEKSERELNARLIEMKNAPTDELNFFQLYTAPVMSMGQYVDEDKKRVGEYERTLAPLYAELKALGDELKDRELYDNNREEWTMVQKKRKEDEHKIQQELQDEFESYRVEFAKLSEKITFNPTESELSDLADEFNNLGRKVDELRYRNAVKEAKWHPGVCSLSVACYDNYTDLDKRYHNLKRTRETQEITENNSTLCAKLANEMKRVDKIEDAFQQMKAFQMLEQRFRGVKGYGESDKLADECKRRYRILQSKLKDRRRLFQILAITCCVTVIIIALLITFN